MKRLMLWALSMILFGSLAIVAPAQALLLNVRFKSVHCDELVTGISPTDLVNQNVVCSIKVTEILRACVNQPKNAANANGTPFQVNETLVKVNLGSQLPPPKKGKSLSELVFTDEDIKAFLPPELVDPALVCPNANWHVLVQVTKLDVLGELLDGAAAQPGAECPINADAFDAPNPFNCATAAAASVPCVQKECKLFSPCLKDHLDFSLPDTATCTCVENIGPGGCTVGIK